MMADSRYGAAVASEPGGYIVVGGPGGYYSNRGQIGSVFVFASASVAAEGVYGAFRQWWPENGDFETNDFEAGDEFGAAVAVSGDVVVVGAPGDDFKAGDVVVVDSGSAYVVTYDGSGTWAMQAKLELEPANEGARFGSAVAASGQVVAVGTGSSEAYPGAVHIFTPGGAGGWEKIQELVAEPDGDVDWCFGHSLALEGCGPEEGPCAKSGVLVVGSPQTCDGNNLHEGRAYVYRSDGAAFVLEATLTADEPRDNAGRSVGTATRYFGNGVALTGDATLVVGVSCADEDDACATAGAAVVFRKARLGAPWAQAHLDATLDDDRAGAGFGARGAVAAEGDAIVVGAAPEDADAGAAYVSCEATCAAAAYAFEDDVDAEGGAGPDGTLIGDAAYGTGMAGRGLVFSGVAGEYVEFPVALTARLGGAAPRSVCLWAKDVAFNGGALFAYGTQTGNELFSLKTKDSALEFNLKVGPGAANDHKFTVDGWTADAWHHLCVVYERTFVRGSPQPSTAVVYVDKAVELSVELDAELDTAPTALRLGEGWVGANANIDAFAGALDELRVYGCALDAAGVAADFDAGAVAVPGRVAVGGAVVDLRVDCLKRSRHVGKFNPFASNGRMPWYGDGALAREYAAAAITASGGGVAAFFAGTASDWCDGVKSACFAYRAGAQDKVWCPDWSDRNGWTEADAETDVGVGKKAKGNYVLATCVSGC